MNENDTFNIDILNNIKKYKDKIEYCKKTLGNPIGNGSGRCVFLLNGKQVLKVAKNKIGVRQNKNECKCYLLTHEHSDLLLEIFENDSKYAWVISKKANAITKENIDDIFPDNKLVYNYLNFICFKHSLFRNRKYDNVFKNINENDTTILGKIYNVYKNIPFLISDIDKMSSWGFINENDKIRLVIIDYGSKIPLFCKWHIFTILLTIYFSIIILPILFVIRFISFGVAIIKDMFHIK